MNTIEILTIIAVFLSPLIALQVSKWLELQKEKRDRRLYIFRTLMTTRAARISLDHVTALNMIDMEYYGDDNKSKNVMEAWKLYRDHLNNKELRDRDVNRWVENGDEKFTDLLQKIAMSCKYKFDKSDLSRPSYYPQGHENVNADLNDIRVEFARIARGEKPFPISIINNIAEQNKSEAQD